MNRNKIYLSAATLLMLLVFSISCTEDFEKINTNSNKPGLSQAAPDMLLTNAIESMTDRVHNIFFGHEMGSAWVQHMAKVQYTDEDRYIPRMSVINAAWSSLYASSGMDMQLLYNIGVENSNSSYQAVALILKSYIMSVVTDEWGDVPYTEAFLGGADEAILSPAYDKQESIYVALLANLEQASTLLDDGAEIGGDILFDGDLMAWKKFANSLRLRLLMRQSDKVDPSAAMTAIFNSSSTIISSNSDNAALIYLGAAPNNHPFNENRKTRDDHRVSNTIVNYLYTDAPSPDYRVVVYAEMAANSGDWVGMPNGMLSADAGQYLGNGLAETSKIGEYFTRANAPGMLMSYAEVLFIKAEAAARGFIPGGDDVAEEAYHDGIKASWDQYNADGTFADALGSWESTFVSWGMGADDDIYDFAWVDFVDWGGTYDYDPANGLEQIATQKWVAMFDQGLQAAFEWRRTGYPVLTPAISGENGGKIPVRAYYPSDEAARNPSNLDAAVAGQGADDLNTKVWWDVVDNF
ncbi:MAG: SusD/RagB family nutrient-binding outer membrane lipoprotein [Bacteroidetes bacterium]|nr:SusD/RagB family nutrient-binding outer membrane lipoprotein [Bacteroidota bacterium]